MMRSKQHENKNATMKKRSNSTKNKKATIKKVVQTARKLGRSARDYILDAIRAQLNSEQAPLLLA